MLHHPEILRLLSQAKMAEMEREAQEANLVARPTSDPQAGSARVPTPFLPVAVICVGVIIGIVSSLVLFIPFGIFAS